MVYPFFGVQEGLPRYETNIIAIVTRAALKSRSSRGFPIPALDKSVYYSYRWFINFSKEKLKMINRLSLIQDITRMISRLSLIEDITRMINWLSLIEDISRMIIILISLVWMWGQLGMNGENQLNNYKGKIFKGTELTIDENLQKSTFNCKI